MIGLLVGYKPWLPITHFHKFLEAFWLAGSKHGTSWAITDMCPTCSHDWQSLFVIQQHDWPHLVNCLSLFPSDTHWPKYESAQWLVEHSTKAIPIHYRYVIFFASIHLISWYSMCDIIVMGYLSGCLLFICTSWHNKLFKLWSELYTRPIPIPHMNLQCLL